MVLADWGVFKDSWIEFKKNWFGWIVTFLLISMGSALVYIVLVLPLSWLLGWEENKTTLQEYVQLVAQGTAGTLGSYWLLSSVAASLWPHTKSETAAKDSLQIFPQFLLIQCAFSAIHLTVDHTIEPIETWLVQVAINLLFILYVPLIVHRRMSAVKALFRSPILLFKHPGHMLIFLIAFIAPFAGMSLAYVAPGPGIWLFVIGVLVLTPISVFITLLTLDQITDTSLNPQTENSATNDH